MNLRSVREIGENLNVVLRMDTDLPIENGVIIDNSRLLKSIPTIKLLVDKNDKIIVLGHRGRPEGIDSNKSLKPVYAELLALLEDAGVIVNSIFIEEIENTEKVKEALQNNDLVFFENLRFWEGEVLNDPNFLINLTEVAHAYVNDAFASHQKHRSIMLHNEMESYYGESFVEEAEKISQAVEDPQRPLTIILGGAKEDKLKYLDDLTKIADFILVGGKLPKIINKLSVTSYELNEKIKIAKLREDGLDLSDEDIERFKKIISNSKTIIWAGAMGFFEDKNHRRGTEEIAKAVAASNAVYKIIAGGDTRASVVNLGLEEKIDFICSGGGSTLEYLAKGSLPAWE